MSNKLTKQDIKMCKELNKPENKEAKQCMLAFCKLFGSKTIESSGKEIRQHENT